MHSHIVHMHSCVVHVHRIEMRRLVSMEAHVVSVNGVVMCDMAHTNSVIMGLMVCPHSILVHHLLKMVTPKTVTKSACGCGKTRSFGLCAVFTLADGDDG